MQLFRQRFRQVAKKVRRREAKVEIQKQLEDCGPDPVIEGDGDYLFQASDSREPDGLFGWCPEKLEEFPDYLSPIDDVVECWDFLDD